MYNTKLYEKHKIIQPTTALEQLETHTVKKKTWKRLIFPQIGMLDWGQAPTRSPGARVSLLWGSRDPEFAHPWTKWPSVTKTRATFAITQDLVRSIDGEPRAARVYRRSHSKTKQIFVIVPQIIIISS